MIGSEPNRCTFLKLMSKYSYYFSPAATESMDSAPADAQTDIIVDDDESSGDLIDLSAEAVAEGADILEDVAYDTIKRPLDESIRDKNNDNHARKKKRINSNQRNTKKKSKYDTAILNESTTIEDLNTIDASAYLAWVNSQADSLPSVFVAEQHDEKHENKHVDGTSTIKEIKKRKEDPIDGSVTSIQILLSKQMDILPPPSIRHIPPACNSATCHINNHSSTKEATDEMTHDDKDDDTTSHDWVATTISNFSKMRSYLETQDSIQKQSIDAQIIRKIAVPKMKDRCGWHVFCLGREEAFGNQGGFEIDSESEESSENCHSSMKSIIKSDDDVDTEGADQSAVNENSDEYYSKIQNSLIYNQENVPSDGYKPTTSLLFQIDQVLTRVLFHHHVHYLCEWKFPLTYKRASWLFALLARMDKPWHRDECCAVRRVLRECCSRRWELSLPTEGEGSTTEENDKIWEQLALLNTIIAITGIYYEQGSKACGGDGMDLLFSASITP